MEVTQLMSNALPSPTKIDGSTRRHFIIQPFNETKECDSDADTIVLEAMEDPLHKDPDAWMHIPDKPPSPTYSEGYTSDAWMADNLETSRLEAEEYRKELEAKGEKDSDLTVAEIQSLVADAMPKDLAKFRDAKDEAHTRSRSTYNYWADGFQADRTQPANGEPVDMKYMKVKPYNFYESHPEAVPKVCPPTRKCASLSLSLSLSLFLCLPLSLFVSLFLFVPLSDSDFISYSGHAD